MVGGDGRGDVNISIDEDVSEVFFILYAAGSPPTLACVCVFARLGFMAGY